MKRRFGSRSESARMDPGRVLATGVGRRATKRTRRGSWERVDSRDGIVETAKNSLREKRAYSLSTAKLRWRQAVENS
jgi:hypothetical protein